MFGSMRLIVEVFIHRTFPSVPFWDHGPVRRRALFPGEQVDRILQTMRRSVSRRLPKETASERQVLPSTRVEVSRSPDAAVRIVALREEPADPGRPHNGDANNTVLRTIWAGDSSRSNSVCAGESWTPIGRTTQTITGRADPRTLAPFSGPRFVAGSPDDGGRYIYTSTTPVGIDFCQNQASAC
jgi:hypothetical protein